MASAESAGPGGGIGGNFFSGAWAGSWAFSDFFSVPILVPIFPFFFLKESPAIANKWSQYLPLRASPLKIEIVSLVSEINSYLISFFRGQLLVGVIEGAFIAVALLFMRLEFGLLIGLMVAAPGILPVCRFDVRELRGRDPHRALGPVR